MYLSSYHDICDIYHQNNMTEINSFDIYSWHKQLTYDTCQEIILPTTWKKSPSGWTTPEIILLNDLKTHQKWGLAFPMPLILLYKYDEKHEDKRVYQKIRFPSIN